MKNSHELFYYVGFIPYCSYKLLVSDENCHSLWKTILELGILNIVNLSLSISGSNILVAFVSYGIFHLHCVLFGIWIQFQRPTVLKLSHTRFKLNHVQEASNHIQH